MTLGAICGSAGRTALREERATGVAGSHDETITGLVQRRHATGLR